MFRLRFQNALLFVFASIFPLLAVNSATEAPTPNAGASGATLSWQRSELQYKIQVELTKILTGMLGPDKFVVTVDIKHRKPPVIAKKNETRVVPSSEPDQGENENSFLLSKLGITVSKNLGQDRSIASISEEAQPEAPDIFDLIEKVSVTATVDSSIEDARFETIKKVIRGQLVQFGKNVEVNIEKVQLWVPPKEDPATKKPQNGESPDQKPQEPKGVAEKFEPFKYPLTIFLSFLTVMAMMFVMFRAMRGQNAAGASPPAATSETTKAVPEQKQEVVAEVNSAPHQGHHSNEYNSPAPSAADGPEVQLTVEKFKVLLERNERKASSLLNEWVNAENPLAIGSIKTLLMHMSLDEFSRATSGFDAVQKKQLKKAMNSTESELPAVAESMAFVRAQLLSAMLSDDSELSEQHRTFVSSLKASEIALLASEDPGLAGGIINVIPSDLVAQIFNLLSGEAMAQVLQLSLQFKAQELISRFSELETKVASIREREKVTLAPVLDGVETLLQQVTPDKEGHLFGALVASRAYAMVEQLSKRYFPSELIFQLEPAKLNTVLLRMPLNKRAELIFALGESERSTLLKAIGEGSKIRELIDSEVESIQTDEPRKKSIEMNRDAVFRQFVALVRETMQSNAILQESGESILKAWIETKKAESGGPSAAA